MMAQFFDQPRKFDFVFFSLGTKSPELQAPRYRLAIFIVVDSAIQA